MFHIGDMLQISHERIIYFDWLHFIGVVGVEVADLNMRTESDCFVPDFFLEANHHTYSHYHHSQTYSNGNSSNPHCRSGYIFISLFFEMNAFGYEIFKIHGMEKLIRQYKFTLQKYRKRIYKKTGIQELLSMSVGTEKKGVKFKLPD